MKKYAVTIQATITKTIIVEAENEDDAYNEAHELFNVNMDAFEDYYEEETLSCNEIEE